MRYLAILKGTQPDTPPPPALMEAIMKLGEDAVKAGVLLDQGGLSHADSARLAPATGGVSVTDGPFAESKEMLSYAVYQVRSKDEVVEWTRRFIEIHQEHWEGWTGEAEVVRIFGPEDAPPQ